MKSKPHRRQSRNHHLPRGTLTKADQCYTGGVDGISDIGMS
jgi:hypothetical protein